MPDLTRASATFMRDIRIKFLGAVLQLVSRHSNLPARWITLSHPDWSFGGEDPYWNEFDFDAPRVFRSLLRIGGIMTTSGYLIAYIPVSYTHLRAHETRHDLV